MGLFDIFKKKEDKYDTTNITIKDLNVGFVFDYDLDNWEVKAHYEYDWGDECFSQEYKISNGVKTLYLSVEDDDELELSISSKIKVRQLGADVHQQLMDTQKAPSQLEYEGRTYFLDEESAGFFNDSSKGKEWVEFISWSYEDESGDYLINIEQWNEREFEASVGKYIDSFEISNILPQ